MGGGGFLRLLVATLISTTAAQVVNCDFETGFCQWTQVKSDKLDWTRQQGETGTDGTGPSTDNTSKNGFYIYLETSNGTSGDNAQLQSPALTVQNHKACLQFYYNMFGTDVADLNVYTVQNNGAGSSTKIWTKHGSQGEEWIRGQVDINIGTNFVIIFEATRGASYLGDIAIDDIQYFPSGACVIEQTSCTFEEDTFCNYTEESQGTFRWVISEGSSTFTRQPVFDHTTGTIQGRYAFLDASAATQGQAASLLTSNITDIGNRCLHFYYSMLGGYPGTLYVSVRPSNGSVVILWSINDVRTTTWIANELQLPQGLGTYQVVFQAVAGYQNSGGTFSVDDITYSSKACRPAGTCDFEESDLCTWSNDDSDQFQWIILQGKTESQYTGPDNDHTFGNSSGHYVYIDASGRQPGDIARLVSSFITVPQLSPCFSFMYNMNGKDIGTLNIYVKFSSVYILMWTLSGNQSSSWMPGSFTLPQTPYAYNTQIIIESVTAKGYRGDIALDDLKLNNSFCSVTPSTALPTTAAPTSRVTSAANQATFSTSPGPAQLTDCDFEQDYCQWTQHTGDDKFNWTRMSGNGHTQTTGPFVDHTLKTASGHYIYIETSSPRIPNDTAVIESPVMQGSSPTCLLFWYHMFGASINALNLYTKLQGQSKVLLWTRHQNQGSDWIEAAVDLPANGQFTILFEGVRGINYEGDIGLDDISTFAGTCSSDNSRNRCDFETDMCGYSSSSPMKWQRWQGITSSTNTGPKNDHTYQTVKGHFAYVEASSPAKQGDKVTMLSMYHPATNGQCVSYYYSMYGSQMGTLSVRVRTGSGNDLVLATHTGNMGNKWNRNEVTVTSTVQWKLLFESTIGTGPLSDIAVDDIVISDGACGATEGSCSFEIDMCTWSNAPEGNDWVQTSFNDSRTSRPSTDHTKGTRDGQFLLLNYPSDPTSNTGILVSTPMSAFNGTKCFTFWYIPFRSAILNVYVTDVNNQKIEPLWSLPTDAQNVWSYASIPIQSQTFDYEILIEGTINSGVGYIALDDFTGARLTTLSCPFQPPNAQPYTVNTTPTTIATTPTPFVPNSTFDCSFEKDFCTWKQETSLDNFDWFRAQGPKGSNETGPITDHTTLSNSGWYLFITSTYVSNPDQLQNMTAWLDSQTLPASAISCLQFYYHMFGPHVGSLNVYVQPSSGNKRQYVSKNGNHGNQWLMLQVQVSSDSNSHIIIEGVRGVSYLGDIAIDDIRVLTNSQCPNQAGPSCTFDYGVCGWTQGIAAIDNFNWELRSGSTASSGTGPNNDHTLGTTSGQYYHIDASYPDEGDFAFLISPTINTTRTQCVRFWFSMNGLDIGELQVGLMTGNTITSAYQSLWSLAGHQSTDWLQAEVTVDYPDQSYKVVFKGIVGNGFRGDIAVDDVTFVDGECPFRGNNDFENGLDLYTNVKDGTDKFDWFVATTNTYLGRVSIPFNDHTLRSSTVPSQFDCNFEANNLCLWLQAQDDTFNWTIQQPSAAVVTAYDAKQDHTTGTNQGRLLHLPNSQSRQPNDTAGLVTPSISSPGIGNCLTFWYRMYGPNVNGIQVYKIVNTNSKTLLWKREGTQGTAWRWAQIETAGDQTYQFEIVGLRGTNYLGATDIDDIRFSRLPCSHANFSLISDCDFEHGLCGFTQSKNDTFDWTLAISSTDSYTGPASDHTYGTSQGHYMYTEASAPRKHGDRARIISPIYPGGGIECLQFYYYMHGSSGGSLNVYLQNANKTAQGSMIWNLNVDSGNQWLVAQASINRASPFQIEFEGIVGANSSSDVAIDDIQILPNPCPNPMSCDFEGGFCTFHNIIGDNSDWVLSSPQHHIYPPGTPTVDHTTGSSSGNYAAATLSSLFVGSFHATLVSDLQPPTTGKCLRFAYSISGNGILQVTMNTSTSNSTLLQLTNPGGKDTTGNWKLIEQNFISDVAYSVSFDAQQALISHVTVVIDDVQLLDDIC